MEISFFFIFGFGNLYLIKIEETRDYIIKIFVKVISDIC